MKPSSKAVVLTVAALVCLFFSNARAHGDYIYVLDTWSSEIIKFDPSGSRSVFANTAGGGLAFDSSGNLYVPTGSSINKFDPSGNESVFASAALNWPTGMAFDRSGNLYAANWNANTIEKFTPSGSGSVFASSGLNMPMGLAFDSSGNLFVASQAANTIMKFDPSGKGSVFANSGLNQPMGMAFDSRGNLFVVNNGNLGNNTIVEFDAHGNESLFASGLLDACWVAVRVPEPASWALLALGIGALLGGWRLRRRSSVLRQTDTLHRRSS